MNEEKLLSKDGVKIFVRSWRPSGAPRAAIVICHGVKSHSGYFQWAAEQFVAMGCAVYALDLRGRGKSEGPRLFIDDISEYVADVSTVIQAAKSREPSVPVFLLGHSAGGVVSCTYALDHQNEINGLICESFAYRVYAPNFVLNIIKGLSKLAPRLPILKLNSSTQKTSRATRTSLPR